jgi:hypothetical protein
MPELLQQGNFLYLVRHTAILGAETFLDKVFRRKIMKKTLLLSMMFLLITELAFSLKWNNVYGL